MKLVFNDSSVVKLSFTNNKSHCLEIPLRTVSLSEILFGTVIEEQCQKRATVWRDRGKRCLFDVQVIRTIWAKKLTLLLLTKKVEHQRVEVLGRWKTTCNKGKKVERQKSLNSDRRTEKLMIDNNSGN